MNRVCVFCGSSEGARPAYLTAATAMGAAIAGRGLELVYGGGHVGLMGAVADAALAAGGRVTGIMPQALFDREIGHTGLTSLEVVGSMHQRKARMAELSDAFIALPGGFGTLEEFCEIITWAQLGLHRKPFGILNVEGFYNGFLTFADYATAEGFVRPRDRAFIMTETDPDALLDALLAYEPTLVPKWIDESDT